MLCLELAGLPIRPPTQVAVVGVPQIRPRDLLKAARRVETGREFVRQGFDVEEAVVARHADGLLVAVFRIDVAAFDAGDLGGHERGVAGEVLGAEIRPDPQFTMMVGQDVQMRRSVAGRERAAEVSPGQRAVEVVLGFLEERVRAPEPRLGMGSGLHRGCAVAGKIARLEFPDPVPAGEDRRRCR
ncbi:hypothetical protein D3C72_1149600 [compost metagenome]